MQHKQQTSSCRQQIQRWISDLTCELFRNFQQNRIAYIVLKAIEIMQIIYVFMRIQEDPYWNFSFVKYFSVFVNFTAMDRILYKLYPNVLLPLLIGLNAMGVLIFVAAILVVKYSGWNCKLPLLVRLSVQLLNYWFYLFKTILLIPIITLITVSLIPNVYNGFGFDSPYSILILLMGILLTIIFIVSQLYLLLLFRQSSPFSELPHAGQTIFKGIIVLIFKTVIAVYTSLDLTCKMKLTFNPIFLGLILLIILYLHRQTAVYKQFQINFQIKSWYLILAIGFMHTCNKYGTKDLQSFLYLFPFIFMLYLFQEWVSNWLETRIGTTNLTIVDDSQFIIDQVLYLVHKIDEVDCRENRIILEGFLQYHRRECYYGDECPCKQLGHIRDRDQSTFKAKFYTLTVFFLQQGLRRFPDQQKKLNLLLGLLYFYRIKNPLQAIYAFSKVRKGRSDILDRLYSRYYLQSVQRQMQSADQKQSSNTLDINKYFQFSNKLVEFEKNIQMCSNHHILFWKLMLDHNPEIKRLQELGTLITRSKDNLKEEFQFLFQNYNSSIHMLTIYGRFLLQVTNQESYNVKYLEKAQSILENMKQSSKFQEGSKYNQNAFTGVVVISGDSGKLGHIVHTNNLIKKQLGYSRPQLMDKNVGMIMPKIYADHHNEVLSRYIKSSSSKVNGMERIVPALGKAGFMLPVTALTKVLPNLQEGIQIVAFLAKLETRSGDDQQLSCKVNYLLYRTDTQQILGISQGAYLDYHIHPSLVYGHPQNLNNELKIHHLFKISFQKAEQGRVTAALDAGDVIMTINTTSLADQFVIGKGTGSQSLIDDIQMEGVQMQVAVRTVLSSKYYGLSLKLVAFYSKNDHIQGAGGERASMLYVGQPVNNGALGDTRRKSSSMASQTRLAEDDMKDLKDFKNFISLKTQPRAITIMSTICIFFLIIQACLVVGLMINWTQLSTLNNNMLSINKLTLLSQIGVPQILGQLDKIIIAQSSWSGNFTSQQQSKALLKRVIQQTKDFQINLLPQKKKLDPQYYSQVLEYRQWATGKITSSSKLLQNTIANYISNMQTISLSKLQVLANFNSSSSSNLHQKYYSAKLNILHSLRRGLNSTNIQQEDRYTNQFKYRQFIIVGISSAMIVFSILWVVLLLPQVLSVTKINNRVLSLFCLIPYQQVCKLIYRCLSFMHLNLTQAALNPDDVKHYQIQQKNSARGKEFYGQDKIQQSVLNSPNSVLMSGMNSPSQMGLNSQPNTQSGLMRHNNSNSKWIESAMSVQQKFAHMNNSQDGNKKVIIFKFIVILLLLLAFMLFYLFFSLNAISQASNHSSNYIKLGRRPALLRNCKLLVQEYMINPLYQPNNLTSIRRLNQLIISQFYALESTLIFLSLGDYASAYNNYNYNDLCDNIPTYNSAVLFGQPLSSSQCLSIDQNILRKGMKTGIVSMLQDMRSLLSYYPTFVPYNVTKDTILKFDLFVKYIQTPMLAVLAQVQSSIASLINMSELVIIISGSVFMLILLICWKFIWVKYLEEVNIKIWRTRGLLNLIPMSIITDNQLLKREFTSGHLEKAVR